MGGRMVPIADPALRLATGETTTGLHADSTEAVIDLGIDLATAGVAVAAEVKVLKTAQDVAVDTKKVTKTPAEAYNRRKHYGNTPTQTDRKAVGAGEGQAADHDPPLVKRYYEGDPATGEKPGFQMTDAERRASAQDRTRMNPQPQGESNQQGGQMSQYSKQKKKEHGL